MIFWLVLKLEISRGFFLNMIFLHGEIFEFS
jgi:hypothetical protein